MALKAAQCPNCGGEMQLPEDKNNVTCMYCDTSIVVSEAIEQKKKHISEDADKLLNLINSSIETRDLEQASKNINQLLELEPDNCDAWMLKGKVAFLKISKEMAVPPSDPRGMDDSVLSVDLHKTFNEGFNKAISFAEGNNAKLASVGKNLYEAVKDVSGSINDAYKSKFFYGIKLYESSIRTRQEHWSKLLNQCIQILMHGNQIYESNQFILLAIEINKKANNIMMADFKTFRIDANTAEWFAQKKVQYKTDLSEDDLNNNLTDEEQVIKLLQEGKGKNAIRAITVRQKTTKSEAIKYINQIAEKNNLKFDPSTGDGNCFIATATMGDFDHPVVVDLRVFRDNWLLERNWGKKFVAFYYKYGPYPAKAIEGRGILKKLSYWMIVKPLHIFTKHLK